MGAGDRLRDLDSVVLPPLARVLARLGTGPTRARVLSGAALLSVTAVLVTAVWAADRAPGDSTPTPDLLRVGVVEGQSVPGYVRSSQGELAALLSPSAPAAAAATETYALVSLVAYLAPDRLAPVLSGAVVAQVYARAPLTGIQTQVVRIPAYQVPEDVVAGMLDVARRRDREQAEFAQLSVAMSEDGMSGGRLHEAYATAAHAAAAEALAYRGRCSCVFAAVVIATPAELGTIADRSEVRAVDPAPEVRHLDRVEFSPPLPEQQTVVPGPSTAPTGSTSTQAAAPAPAQPQTARETPSPVPPSTPAPVTSDSSRDPGADSTPSVGSTEESTAVPSALPAGPDVSVPSETVGASPDASGR